MAMVMPQFLHCVTWVLHFIFILLFHIKALIYFACYLTSYLLGQQRQGNKELQKEALHSFYLFICSRSAPFCSVLFCFLSKCFWCRDGLELTWSARPLKHCSIGFPLRCVLKVFFFCGSVGGWIRVAVRVCTKTCRNLSKQHQQQQQLQQRQQ